MPYADGPGGARLYFEDTGGSGPCVAFSHGILMDHEMFEPQIDALSSEYRCVSWDERGHGGTESSGSFTYWDSATDLFAILDHLGVDSAVLVGMSQGGFLSLRAALLEPERVRALVLIDSQAGLENPDSVPIYEAMVREWLANGPSDAIADATARIIVEPAEVDAWKKKWFDWPRSAIPEIFETLTSRDDITDRLGEIHCPALVVHGDADPAILMERAERLCEGLPGCAGIVRVAGGGHASNLSNPGVVNDALGEFLGRHVRSGD